MIDVKNASNNGMNCLNGSYPLTLYAMYEKDKILNSFPPDLAKDVRRVLDMLVMKK